MELVRSSIAAPNIALVKYWGKRDDVLKLPVNDSISITLDSGVLASKTTIMISDRLAQDVFVINGKKTEDAHIAEALTLMRTRLGSRYPAIRNHIMIISENNFPTSAGIASSASGFAALAEAIASALGISDAKEKSILARLGSGSASRSVFGGFVKWNGGSRSDGEDSYGIPLAPPSHWPDLVDLIAISDTRIKKVSSKDGMERSALTSEFFIPRRDLAKRSVPKMENAIRNRDFAILAIETMRDSNGMHAVMLDSWPPIAYMNDVSHRIVDMVHEYNGSAGAVRAAYTFDAGPNAHIITTKGEVNGIRKKLVKIKGVKKIIVSAMGEGAKSVEPDKKLVERTLKQLRMRID